MKSMLFVTPINPNRVNNLSITDYLIIYMDYDMKIKRAIPDFNERFMSSENSLINEAINSKKMGLFKILSMYEVRKTDLPVLRIYINEDGDLNAYNEDIEQLDNLLIDTKREQSIFKILKKEK